MRNLASNVLAIALGAGLAALGGCVNHLEPLTGTTSLRVELIDPSPGTPDQRLDKTVRAVTIKVTALDPNGMTDVAFNGDVQAYAQFLGGLTPNLEASSPLASIPLTAGVSAPTLVTMPDVFGSDAMGPRPLDVGPAILWIEDGRGDAPSFATGTTPTIWFQDPTLADISTPRDPDALDALAASPLQNKQVGVSRSRYPTTGKMVVTGIFAQGYTLSDSDCATTPCTTGDYDHVLIFTFSRPVDQNGHDLELGQTIARFAGAVSEFNGLTEIGFPQTFISADPANPAQVPAPRLVDQAWLNDPIQFEKIESGLVEIDGGTLCPLDFAYTTFKQWKLDIGSGCGRAINFITSGVIDFDPAQHVGQVIPKVVGALRPVITTGGTNVWIVYPRFAADLTLP